MQNSNLKFSIFFWLIILTSSCNTFGQQLIPFSLHGLEGYVDANLNVKMEPHYLYASEFYNEFAIVGLVTGEKQIIDKSGKEILILDSSYQDLRYVTNDVFAIAKDQGYKLIQPDSNTIITQSVAELGGASNGIIALRYDSDSGMRYIDINGELLFPNKSFRKAFEFSDGVAVVITDNWAYGILNSDGEFVREANFRRLGQHFSEGLCPAQASDRSTGYVNTDGTFAFNIPIVIKNNLSESATDFDHGFALVHIDESPNVWKIINKEGEYVSNSIFIDWSSGFSEGIALVSINKDGQNFFGYILTNGDYLSDLIFEYAEPFYHGYAKIILNGREGLINADGIIYWSDEIVQENVN